MALDTIFVMSMIFTYVAMPARYQHRVLFYGILGRIDLTAIMIGIGAANDSAALDRPGALGILFESRSYAD